MVVKTRKTNVGDLMVNAVIIGKYNGKSSAMKALLHIVFLSSLIRKGKYC